MIRSGHSHWSSESCKEGVGRGPETDRAHRARPLDRGRRHLPRLPGAGWAYAVLPAKQYEATVVLLAQPPANSVDPGSDVSAIQIEIPQIAVEAENAIIAAEASRGCRRNSSRTPVKISATGDPASNSVTITASSRTRRRPRPMPTPRQPAS